MDIGKIFQSKSLKITLWVIGGLVIALLIFQAGMFVGFRKAEFSRQWGENYHRNFAGPRGGFMEDVIGRDFIDSHGVIGQIAKIDGSNLIIKGNDNVEKIILVTDKTDIRFLRDAIKVSDLKIDDNIVVIGSPNDAGQIEARLIRVMPLLPQGNSGKPLPPPQEMSVK
ncbi:MAG: hypothetical protein WC310_00025 [Patescibacteria group bacterium]|jgi:hypothetical protein